MRTSRPLSRTYSGKRFLFLAGSVLFLAVIGWTLLPNSSLAAFQESAPATSKPSTRISVPGEILVRFRPSAPAIKTGAQLELAVVATQNEIPVELAQISGPEIVGGLRLARVAPADTERAIEALRNRSDVIYAEPNYIRRKSVTPNDPRYSEMWNLRNTLLTGGTRWAGINVEPAWNTTTGNRNVVVAVIDEGIDVNHPDLHDNIWRNPGEIAGNHTDDDGNGFVDDLNGYDFFHDDGTVYDGPGTNPDGSPIDSHGTHVAGTIGAQGNNSIGVVGVNWQASLMSLKFLGPDGGTSADVIRAYAYAKMMRDRWISSNGTQGANIRITNNSYGDGGSSQAEADAIEAMGSSGILFVAAAGNDGEDNHLFPHYPASYDLPNVISVASVEQSGAFSSFSNRSSLTVHIGAPGRFILSTTPGNTYSFADGTSMASPHVAGTAALLLAAHPELNVVRLRAAILFGSVSNPQFETVIIGGRLLNAAGSMENAAEIDTVSPAPLSDLRVTEQEGRSLVLNWTAPGDDGNSGQASLYELRFADASTNSQFLIANMHPGVSGTPQSANTNIPFRHDNGRFIVRTIDNAGNSTETNINVSVSDPVVANPYIVTSGAAEPLSVGGNPLGLSSDDRVSGYPLGFTFPFFERFYSSVSISTNGAIYFENPPNYDGVSLAGALNGRVMIAGLWDDLDLRKCFRSDSDVYRVTPDSDRAIFRWQGVKFDSPDCAATPTGADPVNFEIELRRDGTIKTRYGENTPLHPVVGIAAGEPEAYVVDSHTSSIATKDLTNAPALTFSLRQLPRVADLSVSSTVSPNLVQVGQDVTFNISAMNRGPSRTLGVRVVDTLPTYSTFVSCTTSQGSCSGPVNGKVQIDMGLMESGGSATAVIVVKPTSAQFGAFINQAVISGPIPDPDSSNNSSSNVAQIITPNQNPQTGIIGIEAAGNQSFAIRSDRYGLAAGANQFGQLGDGSVADKATAVLIKTITSVAKIEGGYFHTLALKQNGSVWSWGRNDKGQLGDGTTTDRKSPQQIGGLNGVTAISAGGNHSLALGAGGTVWAWGANTDGQLGDGSTVDRAVPSQVPGLTGIISIAAGSNHSLAVKADGTVWAWGGNESGQLGDSTTTGRKTPVQVIGLTNIASVVASDGYSFFGPNGLTNVTFSVALRSDGTVWTWGHNWRGQLGDGTTNNSSAPHQVAGLTGVSEVSAGGFHVVARRNDGTVWAWGGNFNGQLGDTTTTDRYTPVPVVWLTNIQSIATGVEHSLALRQDGHVFGWGSFMNGQLGFGITVGYRPYPYEMSVQLPDPLPIGTLVTPTFSPDGGTFSSVAHVNITSASSSTRIDSIAVGGQHVLARLSDGSLYGWGSNYEDQLAFDVHQADIIKVVTPVRINGLSGLASVSGGGYHNVALKTDGTVWTWGRNIEGELGYDTNRTSRWLPQQIPGLAGVISVVAGGQKSLALKSDGTVVTWGGNPSIPTPVSGLTNVVGIESGLAIFAIRNDGTLWGWGPNYQGEVGDGTTTPRTTPVQVVGLTGVTAVSSGNVSVALKNDGTVWTWGSNQQGQLGVGTSDSSPHPTPTQVPGLTGVIGITTGLNFSLALKADGTVWGWGQNFNGVLGYVGNGRLSPGQIAGLSGISFIEAGGEFAAALRSDGTLFTWGRNDTGQLGDGTTDNHAIPLPMDQLTGGVAIHYTTNGADPTEDDPLFGPAALLIDHPVVLKARAFKYGWTPSAVQTATYNVTAWQPVVLTAQQFAEMKAWTVGGRTYVYVKPQFSDAGYRVTNWGQVANSSSDFTVDASVEKLNGSSIQAVVTTAWIYDLGPLTNGTYNFNFKTSGTLAESLQFTVSSAVSPPNPIDDARQFVKQQYRDFLNREADQAGEDFWTDNITKCQDPARRPPGQTVELCTLRQRETTSGAFFLSPEFQYTGYFVYRMYQGALGRQPKLSEFTPDALFVGNGIIVSGQLSAAKINQNKADFAAQFVNCVDATKYRCAEFKAIYDGLNNQQYVDTLFQTTGVNASASDRAALVNGLNANPATETRATVLQKVVDGINVISEGNQQFTTTYGQAFYNAEFRRAFVQLEYFGYMKRDPDEAGYAFWLGKLNQFNGDFVAAEMVLAFISSPEYRARFGQP